MTTTVQELIAHLKHYPDNTVVTIKHVDDTEFAIVDFISEGNAVNIMIAEKGEDGEKEE